MPSEGSEEKDAVDHPKKRRGRKKEGPAPSVGDILRALKHPIRRRIMRLLSEPEMNRSPLGLSRDLDVSLSGLSYHIRVLSEMGLIRLVRTRQARGSLQHFYASNVVTSGVVEGILSEAEAEDK
jgi:DNA-binding transcriptional ArsR family regulator